MSALAPMPRAARPFAEFAVLLRANGFPVSPDQTQGFIAAVGLLGPRGIGDVHRAAHALFAPAPERRAEFDALFQHLFLGRTLAAPAVEPDGEVEAYDEQGGAAEPPKPEEAHESGAEAAAGEILAARGFARLPEAEALRRLSRAGARLPRRRSRRLSSAARGRRLDLRRAMRLAVAREGEVLSLPALRRRARQRPVLLLIDVSGSMKELTDGHLRVAHALGRAARRLEVFTLGTRLTRVSRALRHRDRDAALARAAAQVADWDGGTRLGDALSAFLAVPRFSGFARGAVVVVLSDGLERGDPAVLVGAVERLSRLAHRILWLSPLAGEAGHAPRTAAMERMAPFIDRLGDGASVAAVCAEILAADAGPAR